MSPKKKDIFVPAPEYLNPHLKSRKALPEKGVLQRKTLNRVVALLTEMEKDSGKTWNNRQRVIAKTYAQYIITGKALAGMTIPQNIKDRVWAAVNQACQETGHQLPARKTPPRGKKRR